ncbi:MAG: hypothetical protein JWM57_2973 [Phycisphaerales bacterium]|nr:hypothetical protein [Phycisphaerales bacterium]
MPDAPPTNPLPPTCYLFTSFRDNGQDGLHLAWSTDGLTWTALAGDRSFLRPRVGKEKLMRDPCVVRAPDGKFHMVWTDSWTDRSIGYASSDDLLHWTPQQAIPVMEYEPTARNCWAPEIVFDSDQKQFLIFWSTTIPGRFAETDNSTADHYNHRIYSTTTKDFKTFTPTQLFYDGGFNVIDATLLADNGKWRLFVKDESQLPAVKKCLYVAHADALMGPYTDLSPAFTEAWVEGPSALRIGEWVYVYYDAYTRHLYGAVRTKDFRTWENVSDTVHFPKGTRHGTALPVPAETIQKLLSAEAMIAPQPLFRDPVYDGAADPVIVWNRQRKCWFMLYTNRRANMDGLKGVAWVHGTRIGIASSPDGRDWTYEGTANIDYGGPDDAHWAPDVLLHDGHYHMFLSIVPGMHTDWNADRRMVHLTSPDLLHWSNAEEIKLSSDRVIDASLMQMPDGTWRMWYNDERDHKSIHCATSPDLKSWTPVGKLDATMPGGEGPKAFHWRGAYWLVVDHWHGLGVARSEDGIHWTRQSQLLVAEPGMGRDDGVMGNHADVLVNGDRAYLFYFTHPGRHGPDAKKDGYEQRRSSIQVVELQIDTDGQLSCDRDQPTLIRLTPPEAD